MKISKHAWQRHLIHFDHVLHSNRTARRPALALYRNDLRTVLFRLEALARIYRVLEADHKLPRRSLVFFKSLEDALGQIDYFDNWQQMAIEHDWPAPMQIWFRERFEEALAEFENRLIQFKLLNKNGHLKPAGLQVWHKQLQRLPYHGQQKTLVQIADFLGRQSARLHKQYASGRFNFHQIEDGLHEFRRRLRWLSIYVHSLNGMICLSSADETRSDFTSFITPESLASPFNQIQCDERLVECLHFRRDLFFALGFLIGRLGQLKDKAQMRTALHEAILASNLALPVELEQTCRSLPGVQAIDLNIISSEARQLCDEIILGKGLLLRIAEQFPAVSQQA
ncbi:MAG: hypothetical protein KDK39_04380 [Leptospiraceae bacterium]|nr:hypothetical protein [Leptospiraceae bacterium]